jgi:hypothetical protein
METPVLETVQEEAEGEDKDQENDEHKRAEQHVSGGASWFIGPRFQWFRDAETEIQYTAALF